MVVDDGFGSGCRSTDPSDVLAQELVEPSEAMLLDDELELVQDAVVIVGVPILFFQNGSRTLA